MSSDQLSIVGLVDVGAHGEVAGVGGLESNACDGADAQTMVLQATGARYTYGAGGGGDATVGGRGGGFNGVAGSLGGQPRTTFDPLSGGCRGGRMLDLAGAVAANGGGGGGAIQLVSGRAIVFNGGFVAAGGGGGADSAGGGSGGLVVLEAPSVKLDGAAGIATNGGSGGCNGLGGQDGQPTDAPAHACAGGSNGGTGTVPAQDGFLCAPNCPLFAHSASGGGSVGRTRIATRTGDYGRTSNSLLSTVVVTGALTPQ